MRSNEIDMQQPQTRKYLLYVAIPLIAVALAVAVYGSQIYVPKQDIVNGEPEQKVAAVVATAQSLPSDATGRMTVYMLPANLDNHSIKEIIETIQRYLPKQDASYYTALGASPGGQYIDEKVPAAADDPGAHIKKGDLVTTTVLKKPADTVNIYVDPAIRKADGTPVTRADFSDDYLFGNGISCCGVTLKDGTDIGPLVLFVVDQSLDAKVMSQLAEIKAAIN